MRFAGGCGIGPAKSWDNVGIFRKVREDGILPYLRIDQGLAKKEYWLSVAI